MTDTLRLYGYEVDAEEIAEGLRDLAYDIENEQAFLQDVDSGMSISADDACEFTLGVTLVAKEGSLYAERVQEGNFLVQDSITWTKSNE